MAMRPYAMSAPPKGCTVSGRSAALPLPPAKLSHVIDGLGAHVSGSTRT
jgi:hypothetical protein